MNIKDIPQFSEMSIEEKILFLEELWDSLSSNEADIPVPQSHKEELDARLRSYEMNPGQLLSLEELQNRIDSRK